MAKILTTAIVADIRNKLNGSVFSKNRYGGYVRTKVTPVNPQSTAQQNVRNRLSTNSQAWRGLSAADRQSWIDAAPSFPFTDIYGNIKILSGNALYVKFNNNLAQLGIAAISTAPTPVAIPQLQLGALSAAAGAGTMTLAFTPTPVPADFELVIMATGNVGPGISFVKNRYRFIVAKDAAATSPADIAAAWAAVHGTMIAGEQIFVQCFFVSKTTGQAGIPVATSTIIAA